MIIPLALAGVVTAMLLAKKAHPTALVIAAKIITDEEGFSAKRYKDADGWSIGYGHFILPNEQHLMSATLTRAEAAELLVSDMAKAAKAVDQAVKVPLTDNQRAALISLAYNIGAGAFAGSTLVKRLNAGDTSGAVAEFPKWNKSDGKVNPTLTKRRDHEKQLFLA